MAEVKLDNLTKVYGGKVTAVDDVTLAVRHNEFLVLVGPSGCGKTTILRMIAGLEPVSAGTIAIDGVPVNDVAPKDRGVAMVFQNYALYPHMTVRDNIAFGLKMAKVERHIIEHQVEDTARMLSMFEYLDRKPRELSGGQRQRVALARAIVKQPKVFLFDEPLSNLDAQLRTQTRAELKKLQQQLETTAVYVTHDRTEAMTLGDRIAVVREGKLQQVDEPLKMYHRPANLFVANFIGTPGINQFRGQLLHGHGKFRFKHHDLELDLHHHYKAHQPGPEVVLAVRPEDMELESSREKGFKAAVDLVEQLGGESLIYATLADGTKAVVRTEGNVQYEQGAHLKLGFKPEAAHLFDAGTELRIE
ncbi:MAG TPA: sn-glycerol-3-phosphate ABC transporter ATP-binding protein UgpC [Candidatus Edwardsbacteria bacterium]|nr:sn-glycerol-3-phosphate ABC transporter ATP-binding protein UgpC [Candidatus Edwardsbacteria bacterium]